MEQKNDMLFAVRCLVMLAGIFLVGASVAMSKDMGLGVSPISSFPAALADIANQQGLNVTMGNLSFAMNFSCFVAEVVLLRRRFPLAQVLQLAILLVLMLSIDFVTPVVNALTPVGYVPHMAVLLLSLIVLSLGVYLEVAANVLILPAEAIIWVVSRVFDKPFSKCKIAFDLSFAAAGALLSFLFLGGIDTVREGTVISALAVGPLVGMWQRLLDPVLKPLAEKSTNPLPPVVE